MESKNISTNFGYKHFYVGEMLVFTCKLMFGMDVLDFEIPLGVSVRVTGTGKVVLSFETIDIESANRMYAGIDSIRKAIAERRFNNKYAHIKAQPILTARAVNKMMEEMENRMDNLVLFDDLPF